MKIDFTRFFNDFHCYGNLSKVVVSSFVILIPKKANAVSLDDFRPIFLVGCLYKTLSKLLAARLKLVLGSIISNSQCAFVPVRQLLEVVMVANEVIDSANKEKRGCLIFKVDFKKEYEKVNWTFLKFILHRIGFGEKWIKWMEALVCTSWMTVLINSSTMRYF